MEGHRTVVLVPPAGSPDHESALGALSSLGGTARDVLLVPMGYSPPEELCGTDAAVRFPEEFFDRGRGDHVDSMALRLARSWYGPLGDELTFEGVNLAQMCEYWFYFVFVDVLRSIEIASRLLVEESPEQIVVPRSILTPEISEICYESLPKAIENLAKSSGAKVKPLSMAMGGNPGTSSRKPHLSKGYIYQRFNESTGPLTGGRKAFFYGVYGNNRIADNAKRLGLRPLKLIPYPRADAKTKDFDEDLPSVRNKWVEMLTRGSAAAKEETIAMAVALERFDEFFGVTAPILAEYVEWAWHFCKRLKPRVMVAMEDITPIHRSMARVFKLNGGQVIVLQHGLLTRDMAGYYLMPMEGDVQAVWGKYYVDWHISRGKEPGALVITGSPNYEKVMPGQEAIEETRKVLGLLGDQPILLVSTGRYSGITSVNTVEKEQRFFDGVYAGLGSESVYRVITKMHPSCGKTYFEMAEDAARRHGVNTQLTRERLRELIALSRIVVIPNSTVGYEAVIMQKPLVYVDFEKQKETSVFVDGGVAVGVTEPDGLNEGLETSLELVSSPRYIGARSDFLERHLNGETPSKSIASLIEERYKVANKGMRS